MLGDWLGCVGMEEGSALGAWLGDSLVLEGLSLGLLLGLPLGATLTLGAPLPNLEGC